MKETGTREKNRFKKNYIKIEGITPGSPAEEMGLEKGDICLELNNNPLQDFLDFQFYLIEDGLNKMIVKKKNGQILEVEFELEEGEHIGIRWEGIKPKTCKNKCIFCFIDQLPKGVRSTLRIKDEDYRFSFLYGNFITLGNMNIRDINRIITQRLSPLYVSVHTTNADLRREMLKTKGEDKFFEYFNTLVDAGITMHTQIVLCPGYNDGKELDNTIRYLANRWPSVQSIGIVPVGLTHHRKKLPELASVSFELCRTLIGKTASMQNEFRKRFGIGFVYLADEFYLKASSPMPPATYYDDYPQLENGIGMVRDFLDTFSFLKKEISHKIDIKEASLVTGKLFAPVLKNCIRDFNESFNTKFQILPIPNEWLGPTITVTGLLSGNDILNVLKKTKPNPLTVIPFNCLSLSRGVFLDDMSLDELSERSGHTLGYVKQGAEGFFKAIEGKLLRISQKN